MRVRGGWSRAHEPQKSLELYAREEYGDRNNFRYAFFENEFTADGELVDRYRRVRLRNGGSDRRAGFIRDELSQTLFRQMGYPWTQTHVPAAVFLNGKYFGVAWLKSPRTGNHLARVFGGESGNFGTVEGGDLRNDLWWDGEYWGCRASTDMREVSRLAQQGFTGSAGEARFAEFQQRICVDSLILYYAMQIYLNNYDWPNHNIELWRYFPTEAEKNDPTLHEFLRDGKWRVWSHDLEAGWGMWDNRHTEDTIGDVLAGRQPPGWNRSRGSAFLSALVGRPDTRAQLANTFVDLIESAFAPENVISVLNDLDSKIENEHHHALRVGSLDDPNENSPGWPNVGSVSESRESIRIFANGRPNVILNSVQTHLGVNRNQRFAVTVTATENGGARMNARPVGASQTVTGNYFQGTQIKISAVPEKDYAIDFWTVNGERREGDFIFVGANSNVVAYFKPAFENPAMAPPSVIINQIHGNGSRGNNAISHGFIELYNPTDKPVYLGDYSLQVANGVGVRPWEMLRLNGYTIQPFSSFLVVSYAWFNEGLTSGHVPRYVIKDYDMIWGLQFDNNRMVVALVNNQNLLSPLITPDEWLGVVDLVGVLNEPRSQSNFVAHYLGMSNAMRISRQVSARRKNFRNTRNNSSDFEEIDYRYPEGYQNARPNIATNSDGITNARLAEVRPRYSGDGQWAWRSSTEIYRMSADDAIQNLPFGSNSLWGSGRMGVAGGSGSLVPHPLNPQRRSIQITNREANWHSINFRYPPLGIEDGEDYRITFIGRTPQPGFNMSISLTEAPHLDIVTVPVTQQNWSISLDFCTELWHWGFDFGLRAAARSGGTFSDLFVDEIIVERFSKVHTVIFDETNGVLINGSRVQKIPHGGAATAPEIVRDGFVLGWDVSFDNVQSDIFAEARWLRLGAVASDGRGDVTSADATYLARHIAGHEGFDIPNKGVADMNADGEICLVDVTMLAQWLVGYCLEYLRARADGL
jgi:hypothetical protein